MQGLIGLYLVTNGLLCFPLIVIIWSLKYGLPSALFPTNPGDGLWFNHGLRSIAVARFEKLFQLFDMDFKDHSVMFALIACVLQLVSIFIIILAIVLGHPLPLIPEVEGVQYMGLMYELIRFAAANNFIHLLPMIGHILYLLYCMPLPFLAELKRNRAQERNEITRREKDSEGFAWVRLTRFENSEKTFIYANCRDERSGKVFKLVLCQGKKTGNRPQCFLYADDESTLEQINPAPVSVKELEEIFMVDDDSNVEQRNPAPASVNQQDEILIPDDESALVQMNPPPASVSELGEIFIPDDGLTTEQITPAPVIDNQQNEIFIPDDDETEV